MLKSLQYSDWIIERRAHVNVYTIEGQGRQVKEHTDDVCAYVFVYMKYFSGHGYCHCLHSMARTTA